MARQADGSIVIDTKIDDAKLKKGISNIGTSLKGITKLVATAFSVKVIYNFTKACIQAASDLEEVQNVVDVVFGESSEIINNFAKNAVKSLGLSELSAKQYASTMGAMLKSMKLSDKQVLTMSQNLTALAGDMASFYNISGDEAFTKLRAGISGETEPLKQLGINLNVANLEAYALSKGIDKSFNSMSQAEQAIIRYNYLLDVTKDAQGDFSRTSGNWANQVRVLSEQWNTFKSVLGSSFIQVLTPIIQALNKIMEKIDFPMFVKPSNSGSSVGISKAKNKDELINSIIEASKFDKKILIEENINGREIECAVLGNEEVKASVLGEILPAEAFYSFSAKYQNSDSKTVEAPDLPEELTKKVRELAVKAYKAADCQGLSRVDFLVNDKENKIYINEINTLPGFTEISMYPKLWEKSGLTYTELLDKLIELAY